MGELELIHSLLDAGVVDEVRMLVCPTSRGKGTRIFEDSQDLKLVDATGFETAWCFGATRSRNKRSPHLRVPRPLRRPPGKPLLTQRG